MLKNHKIKTRKKQTKESRVEPKKIEKTKPVAFLARDVIDDFLKAHVEEKVVKKKLKGLKEQIYAASPEEVEKDGSEFIFEGSDGTVKVSGVKGSKSFDKDSFGLLLQSLKNVLSSKQKKELMDVGLGLDSDDYYVKPEGYNKRVTIVK